MHLCRGSAARPPQQHMERSMPGPRPKASSTSTVHSGAVAGSGVPPSTVTQLCLRRLGKAVQVVLPVEKLDTQYFAGLRPHPAYRTRWRSFPVLPHYKLDVQQVAQHAVGVALLSPRAPAAAHGVGVRVCVCLCVYTCVDVCSKP